MSTEHAPKPGETDNLFASLSPYEFVLLTTFRKSGVGVPTAMWFAHEQGKLYLVTERTSGKIKRIRNNGRVLLAPCDFMGNVLGPQVEGYAHELPADQHAHADALLAQKYGEEYEMDSPGEGEEANEEIYIEIVSRDHVLRGGEP
jgi:PPOX class probable F420-dependent enzyme